MKNTIQHILIPINFSDSADAAITTGIAMCKRHHAALHLLYVKEENTFVFPPGKFARNLELVLEAEMTTLDKLEIQAKKIEKEHGLDCFFYVAEGPMNKAVASIAEDFYCDLIILEKTHKAQLFNFVKNNSASKLTDYVKCPVLTIPTETNYQDFKNVLFPVRPAPAGMGNLEVALPIIKENDSNVLLFPLKQKENLNQQETVSEFNSRTADLNGIGHIIIDDKVNVSVDMAQDVVRKAMEDCSDLIIVTASIKKGLKSLFTRNYTEKIIDNSPVPVLSVKLA